jgi:hypothetical protein
MRRGQFLHCAGVDVTRFKQFKQRDQLPFVISAVDAEYGGAGFTMDDAFRMRLMLDLLGGEGDETSRLGGLGPTYASKFVENAVYLFPRHPLNQIEPLDWFLGVAVFDAPTPGVGSERYSESFACEASYISAWIADKTKPEEDGARQRLVRLFLVNASQAAEFVRDRALEIGIPDEVVFAKVPHSGA